MTDPEAVKDNKRRIYLTGLLSGGASQAIRMPVNLAVIYLVNQILTKDQFGDYSLALTIISFIVLLAPAGLDKSVHYNMATRSDPAGELTGRKWVETALFYSLLSGVILSIALVCVSDSMASVFEKSGLTFWLTALALLIPLDTGRLIYAQWYRGRQKVAEAILLDETFYYLLRFSLVLCVWVLLPDKNSLAIAVLLSSAVILTIWFCRTPVKFLPHSSQIKRSDAAYGLKMMFSSLLNRGLNSIGLIFVGLLASSAATAEYALGTRLAILSVSVQIMVNNVLQPRLGYLHANGRLSELRREYDISRTLSFFCAILSAVIFSAAGSGILGLFGDYENASNMVLILICGYIIRTSTGSNGGYLVMTGRSGTVLFTTITALSVNVMLNLMLIPCYGAMGAAIAMAVSVLVTNAVTSIVIWKLDRFPTFSVFLLFITVIISGILGTQALSDSTNLLFPVALVAVLLLYAFKERGHMKLVFTRIFQERQL